MNILIVEDNFVSRRVLSLIVGKYGSYEVAVNGVEAVDLFNLSCDEGTPYEVVFLDINMPELNGQGTLKAIRKIEKDRGIEGLKRAKIIMTTASEEFEDIDTAFSEQCDAYLVKPIDEKKLEDTLKRVLNQTTFSQTK